jgi:hypothetical protein
MVGGKAGALRCRVVAHGSSVKCCVAASGIGRGLLRDQSTLSEAGLCGSDPTLRGQATLRPHIRRSVTAACSQPGVETRAVSTLDDPVGDYRDGHVRKREVEP